MPGREGGLGRGGVGAQGGPAVAVAVAVLAERAVVRPEVQYGGKSAAIEAGLPLLAILAQRPVKRRL